MPRQPTAYVSGQISGIEGNNREAFAQAIAAIQIQWPGAKVYDPSGFDIRHPRNCAYNGPCDCCEDYFASTACVDYRSTIIHDLKILGNRDILWLIPNWRRSLGSLIELAFFVNAFSPDYGYYDPAAGYRGASWPGNSLVVFPACDDVFGKPASMVLRDAWADADTLILPPGPEPIEHDDETIAQQDAANSAPADLEKEDPT